MRQDAPVFPLMGWSCCACRRSYSVIFRRCPHCMFATNLPAPPPVGETISIETEKPNEHQTPDAM